VNLYELIKQNHFRGLSCHLIRTLLEQLCDTMQLLRAARVIHCDLKPENVLLVKLTSAQIKLIDFGSACMEYQTVYSYIQSRFYRSPEVMLHTLLLANAPHISCHLIDG
jgi:dual specificity protein kinase YAK1